MRKFLISIALVSTALTAVPAMAQDRGRQGHEQRDDHRGDNRGNWNRGGPSRQAIHQLLQDLRQAESQIARSQRRGIISPREAVSLRREANRIRVRLNLAARNRISGREFAQLRVRVNRLERRVRMERRDRDRRPG